MNEYLLFGGQNYYASGGPEDFVKSFATMAEARAYADACISGAVDGESWREWWTVARYDGKELTAITEYADWSNKPSPEWRDREPARTNAAH